MLDRCVGKHDEDGDGIGDPCDVCPTVPDPTQADTSETIAMQFPDGVGDACDPRLGRNGDTLAASHLFTDAAAEALWLGEGWTITSDVARAIAPARWSARQIEFGDGLYVRARVTIISWEGAARFEVVADGDGLNQGHICAIVRDRDGDGADELDAAFAGGQPTTISLGGPVTGPVTISAWRTIDFNRVARFLCLVEHGSAEHEIDLDTIAEAATGEYAFAATGAIADVSSVQVYTFPINPCTFSTITPQCDPNETR